MKDKMDWIFKVAVCICVTLIALSDLTSPQVTCGPGQYDVSGTCTVCPKGTYIATTGARYACTDCAKGTYQDQTGQSSCKNCPLPGETTASTKADNANLCNVCIQGYYGTGGTCNQCPKGKYSDAEGLTDCKSCATGTSTTNIGSTTANSCVCDQGYYLQSTTCTKCAVGYYKTEVISATSCTACNTGYTTLTDGQTTSQACVCDAGYFGSPGSCNKCPVGQYTTQPNQLSCTSCDNGKTTTSEGSKLSTDCVCKTGYKVNGGGCTICGVGTYSATTGATTCASCAADSTTSGQGSSAATDCKCKAGSSGTTGSCITCATGYYQTEIGQSSCTACPSGKTTTATGSTLSTACVCKAGYTSSGVDDGTCTACALGFYKASTGAGTCTECGTEKTTADVGSTASSSCVVGTCTTGQYGTATTCEPCPVGQYQPSAKMGKCIACPNGSTTTTTGQSSLAGCNVCGVGYFGTGGVCNQCPTGFYQSSTGQATCVQCSDSYTPALGATASSACGDRPDDTTKYFGKFTIITGTTWNSDLNNENSNAYQTLVASLTTQLNAVYGAVKGFHTVYNFDFSEGSVDVKYDMLFIGDVDYDNDALETQLKSKLSGGNTLGTYVLDVNSIDVDDWEWTWYMILGIVLGSICLIIIIVFIIAVCCYCCCRDRDRRDERGYYPYPDDDVSYRDSASQKRPEIQRAFANEYSHQGPPMHQAPLPPPPEHQAPPPPPPQNLRQPQYDNRRYDTRPYDNKPHWDARQRQRGVGAPPPGVAATQGGMLRSDAGSGQMPNSGWYCWKDDSTGLYYTYYEDDDKNNTMKTSYADWAKEHAY